MQLDLNWVNILILFGAIQGLVFMGILLSHKRHPGNVYMSLVMLALVYNALETFNWSAGLDKYIAFFDLFPYVVIFLCGPGFYLYYKSLLTPGYVPSRKEILLYFSPFAFQFTYSLIITIGYLAYFKLGWESIATPLTKMIQVYHFYSEFWSLLVFATFTIISVKLVKKHFPVSKAGSKDREKLYWVRSLVIMQVAFAIGWSLTLSAPLWYTGEGSHYYPIELFLVLFLYWSAMAGFRKVKSIQRLVTQNPKSTPPEALKNLKMLQSAMEKEHLYLNPNLNLSMVSDHLNISPKEVSYALNQAGNTNFNDFVNHHRIEAFCNRMAKNGKSHLTMFGVAQECGFNSPATFQRAFKKAKNRSPKAYLFTISEKIMES